MTKSIALLMIVASAGAIGTGYYFLEERNEVKRLKADQHENERITGPESESNEELKRRKIEGIGSVKNLKPVPIPDGPAR